MNNDDRPEAISSHLRAHGLSPRKRLGQNFLRDRSFLHRILDAADIEHGDQVLEIGSGTGVLTRALLERAARVIGIELDDSLLALLQADLGADSRLELWHGNALDYDPETHFPGRYKALGNIPYYVTGPIIRRYLEMRHPASVLVFMVQREVAERIIAAPGHLSVLGVSVQFYAEASIVSRVPASAFYPIPKVDSAILKLVPRNGALGTARDPFFGMVKSGFSMPRKQIANSLAAGLHLTRPQTLELLRGAAIDASRRAETLSVAEWIVLTNVALASSHTGEG